MTFTAIKMGPNRSLSESSNLQTARISVNCPIHEGYMIIDRL